MNESIPIQCPYCGMTIFIDPEPADGPVEYLEDCTLCCRPILYRVVFSEEGSEVSVRREDE